MNLYEFAKRHSEPKGWGSLIGIQIGGALGIATAAVIGAFILGLIVALLWNWLMPTIFDLPTINYWQGWGLACMIGILFKS